MGTYGRKMQQIEVVAFGRSWAIKHGSGFLGVLADRDEAMRIALSLSAWLSETPAPQAQAAVSTTPRRSPRSAGSQRAA